MIKKLLQKTYYLPQVRSAVIGPHGYFPLERYIFLCLCMMLGFSSHAQDFITTWETTTVNETISLPNTGAAVGYNFTVDWGDGMVENNVNTPGKQHTYSIPGTYTVRITGAFEEFDFSGVPSSPSANNLLSVDQWGNLAVSKLSFSGASRVQILAADSPDLTNVLSFENLFNDASAVNADLSGWDVSGITNMKSAFRNATAFNGNITNWNTTEVTDMSEMFSGATAFNQNIGGWITSKVITMNTMFANAIAFNQNIGGWNTSLVEDMEGMFNGATVFNQNIGNWITTNVRVMNNMFNDATAFNANIGGWITSNVTKMQFMFAGASSFNQDIGGWNTQEVDNMGSMFANAIVFNQDISAWVTSKVTVMSFMFSNAIAFNQSIGNWDTGLVERMSSMFNGAISFNQNLGNWDMGNVQSLFNALNSSGLSTLNYDATLIGWANQTLQFGVSMGASGLKYCTSQAARNTLIAAPNTWVISGDSLDCSSLFITIWETTTTNQTIVLPNDIGDGSLQYNFSIDWGDGTPIETNITSPNTSHTYSVPGNYTVRIDGVFESFDFETVPIDTATIFSVEQWGDLSVVKLNFKDAINLEINDVNAPNLSRVTSFNSLFQGAIRLNADLSSWNTVTIEQMNNVFNGAIAFNGDISTWNTSNVQEMIGTFNGAVVFNQDISGWTTSNVTTMSSMFSNATAFDQNIGNWNTASVSDMSNMFNNAVLFNQNIGNWMTSNVTDMTGILNNANAFDQNVGTWNISKVSTLANGLSNSGLSTSNYDATLIGWESQIVTNGVTLGADGLTYCQARDEREALMNTSSWNIIGDSLDCSSIFSYTITASSNAIEGTSNAEFVVSIDGGVINQTGTPITGTITFTGTATNDIDYQNVASFSIANGESEAIITVTVLDDLILEPTETIIATISAPSVGSINMAGNTDTANIVDDESSALTLSIGGAIDAIEGTSNAQFIVSLDGGVINQIGASVTGTITLTGTATNGVDYQDITTFSIADGESQAVVSITVLDDLEVEPTETIIATISAPSVGNINMTSNTDTANIADDEFSSLMLSIGGAVDAVEGTSNVQFTVSLDGGVINQTGTPITGTITLTGTATNGIDYQDVTTFSIANGESEVVIDIIVLDDLDVEPVETIIAAIFAPSIGGINMTNNTDTANIIDDEANSLMLSIGGAIDAVEGTSNAQFTVSLDGGVVNQTGTPITGIITFTGTATNGIDYQDVNTFSIPNGESQAVVSIIVLDDLLLESTETIIATISAPSVGSIDTTNNTDTANILDDEANSLTLSIGEAVDAIEGVSNAQFTVRLDGGVINQTGIPITGLITLTGTATNGIDYQDVTTFSIANGESQTVVVITVLDDLEVEPTETIIATISTPNVASVNITNNTDTANILDNEFDSLMLSIGGAVDAIEGTSNAQFTVRLDGGVINQTGIPITGLITLTGTATNGIDYQDVTTFSIANGESQTIVIITVLDDQEVEPTETIIATISTPSVGNINVSNASDTANIVNDDVPPVFNLALSKSGQYQDSNRDGWLNLGDEVIYTFEVENNGTETLRNIIIQDMLPGISLSGRPIPQLSPGEVDTSTFTAVYQLTETDILEGRVINQAFVTGQNPVGDEVLDFSDDPNNPADIDDDNDGDGEDPTITNLIPDEELIIYEIITPNGDGKNDELRVSGLSRFPNNTMTIYNRWGAKIFEAAGYEQQGVPLFTGTAKDQSKLLPVGAYFFTLEYQNEMGAIKFKSGYLHIN